MRDGQMAYIYSMKTTKKIEAMTTMTKVTDDFKAAKEIAMTTTPGTYQRAAGTNYCGAKMKDGRMWVLGDTENDIQNPDAIVLGKPAREVFGDFSIMYKR